MRILLTSDEIRELNWFDIIGLMTFIGSAIGVLFGAVAIVMQLFGYEISIIDTFWRGAMVGLVIWTFIPLTIFTSLVTNLLGCGADQDF